METVTVEPTWLIVLNCKERFRKKEGQDRIWGGVIENRKRQRERVGRRSFLSISLYLYL